jgi:hypothetical protein
MYVVVASPDKISLGMFIDFYRTHIDKGCPMGNLQYLILAEGIQQFIKAFENQYPDRGIISYYVKKKINIEPLTIIPPTLIEWADVVLWFDLYATEVVSLKDSTHFMNINGNLWKRHIEKMGG